MHNLVSSFVLGYHGCDKATAERLLKGEDFKPSQNDYDWLGPGIYFWEVNPKRGLEWAAELKRWGKKSPTRIKTPVVVGAVIDLGLCLDLTTSAGVEQVRNAHSGFLQLANETGLPLPLNSADGLMRNLDCAVIRMFHTIRKDGGALPVDSVRGVFVEGSPIYQGSGFYAKTHIQVCVCNSECIKGVFRVPQRDLA